MISRLFIMSILLLASIDCKAQNDKQIKQGSTNNESLHKNSLVFHLDFENTKPGNNTAADLRKVVGDVNWISVDNRAEIEQDSVHGNVLKVKYPKGSVGPKQGGIQFDKPIPDADEYYLEYYLKFKEGFDFGLGGKLPGLTSGGAEFTGGIHPNKGEGWSARYMWKKSGEIIVYFYHLDMKGKWGDAIKTNQFFSTGKWYRITQRIKLNTSDAFNGIMEVWIDGAKVVSDADVRYRIEPLGPINSFYFSTFHGGNTQDWAPEKDSYIYFDDFKVSVSRPENLN